MNEEELKEMYKGLKRNKKIIGSIDTDFFFEFAEIVLNLLEKKDKIIDELEYIFYNYQLCEYELTDCTYRKCEYIADDENPPCKECIKQYFENNVADTNVGERKVENEN